MRRGFLGRVLLAAGACCITVLAFGADAAADVTAKDPHPAAAAQPPQAQPEATQASAESQASNVPGADQHWGMLKQYCSKCHNAEDWAGGVAFDTMTPQEIPEQAEIWEHAVRKLRGRLMPPPGQKQPPAEMIHSFVGWMENTLDTAATTRPDP